MLNCLVMPQDVLQITEAQIPDAPSPTDGQRILQLSGPIVLTNLFALQDTMRADTSRVLVLEMSGVPYVDSAGIGVLVGAYVSRQKNSRVLALAGVTERVRTTLHITQVEQLFQFYDSVSQVPRA